MKVDALIWYYYINNTPNVTTETFSSPLLYGQKPSRPWHLLRKDVIFLEDGIQHLRQRLQEKNDVYVRRENQKIQKRTRFNIGGTVLPRLCRPANSGQPICGKLDLPYTGPYPSDSSF